MGYFQILSLILGVLVLMGGIWLLAAPASYRALAEKMIPEKRPAWFLLSAVLMAGLVIFSWFRCLENQEPAAVALCAVLSLTLIKGYFFVFHYEGFRRFALKFISMDEDILRTLGLIYLAAGFLFFGIGL